MFCVGGMQRERERERGLVSRQSLRHKPIGTRRERERGRSRGIKRSGHSIRGGKRRSDEKKEKTKGREEESIV